MKKTAKKCKMCSRKKVQRLEIAKEETGPGVEADAKEVDASESLVARIESKAFSSLETKVAEVIRASTVYDEDVRKWLCDLRYNGCQSGMVSCLIYNGDIIAFYVKYSDDIWKQLSACTEDFGYPNVFEYLQSLNGADVVASDIQFKTLLAWHAFEQTAYELALKAGIEY